MSKPSRRRPPVYYNCPCSHQHQLSKAALESPDKTFIHHAPCGNRNTIHGGGVVKTEMPQHDFPACGIFRGGRCTCDQAPPVVS